MQISPPKCRLCGADLTHEVLDLGMSPPCELFLRADQTDDMEPFYPLRLLVCGSCYLVQLREYVSREEIFTDYAYFSSFAESWVQHAKDYCQAMATRWKLGKDSKVVELASNDGYLLQHFVAMGVPVLGIEPAANVAKFAVEKGVPTRVDFFGVRLARQLVSEGVTADLIAGNNVLAQVPDLNDFIAGMKIILKPKGVVTIEFPHLAKTIEGNQFDQIYHEHFSYFSLLTAEKAFARHGLTLFDVDEVPTHGGSIRIYMRHKENDALPVTAKVKAIRDYEIAKGYNTVEFYDGFRAQAEETKRKVLSFLIDAKRRGKRIVGYGAPGKGNTLLNYCGIRTDFLDFLVDRNIHKHGKFTPGTHIPIKPPSAVDEVKPDYLFILPWNLKNEIMRQMKYVGGWGCKFVIPVPELTVIDPGSI
jgi:SAM-dependent methyltransferase